MKYPSFTPAKGIDVNDGDTTHAVYVTYKIHLLLKFIEIDKVSVNLLHKDNKSDCQKLQKLQETSILQSNIRFA